MDATLADYYRRFYRVEHLHQCPVDTYRADIALLAWEQAKLRHQFNELVLRCDAAGVTDVLPLYSPPVPAAP
jgi:hypothetical protein